jgi:hypothetical protein
MEESQTTKIIIATIPDRPTHEIKSFPKDNLHFNLLHIRSEPSISSLKIENGKINSGDKLIVLEPNIGQNCLWHYVKYSDIVGYVNSLWCKEIEGSEYTFLKFECDSGPTASIDAPIDWVEQEPNKAFINELTKKWYISYYTDFDKLGGTELRDKLLSQRTPATKLLLSSLGKDSSDEYVQSVVNAVSVVKIEDYHLPSRVGQNVKILVSLPIKYIPYLLKGEQQSPTVIDSTEDKKIVLFTSSYKKRILNVAKAMKEVYSKQLDAFDGEISNIDILREADRLERFISRLEEFIILNNLSLTDEYIIELTLNKDFKPLYIAENSSGSYKNMVINWEAISTSEPFDSPRTMNYVFHICEMEKAYRQQVPLLQFLETFTNFEKIQVRPSSKKNEVNTTTDEKLINKIKSATSSDTLKTSNQRKKEEELYKRTDLKNQIYSNSIDNVINPDKEEFRFLTETISKVKNLDDLYHKILNKYQIKDIIGVAHECVFGDLEFKYNFDTKSMQPFFDNVKITSDYIDSFDSNLKELPKLPTPPSIIIPQGFPTYDLMRDMGKRIYSMSIETITKSLVSVVNNMIEAIKNECKKANEDDIQNLNDFISDPKKSELLSSMGLFNNNGKLLNYQEIEQMMSEMQQLLDDISILLSPAELCRAFQAIPDESTLFLIKNLIEKKYSKNFNKLNSKSKIKDFTASIGKIINSDFCESLSKISNTRRQTNCADNSLMTELEMFKSNAYRFKDKNITKEQIEEQLKKERDRRINRKLNLIKTIDLLHKNNNLYGTIVPSIFPTEDQDGNIISGIVDIKNDSLDFMLLKMLDTIFEPLTISFSDNINSYYDTMIKDFSYKRKVSVALKINVNGEYRYIWNPEVRNLELQGSIKFENGFTTLGSEPKAADTERKIEIDTSIKKVIPETQRVLSSIDKTVFKTKIDREGIFYELTLPQDKNVISYMNSVKESIGDSQEFNYEKIKNKLPDWKLRYKNNWRNTSNITIENKIYDEYTIEIFPDIETDISEEDILKVKKIKHIGDKETEEYIKNLYLDNTSLETELFSVEEIEQTLLISELLSPENNNNISINATQLDGGVKLEIHSSNECIDIDSTALTEITIYNNLYNPNLSVEEIYRNALFIEDLNERGNYIISYMWRQDAWSVLKPLWDEGKYWMLLDVNSVKTSRMPLQQVIFGLHVRRKWYQKFSELGQVTIEIIEYIENIRKFYTSYAQPQIVNDIIKLIADQISNSIFFGGKKVNIPKNNINLESSNFFLERINFLREPDKHELACNIDPHILSLQEFKSSVEESFKSSGGFFALISSIKQEESGERDKLNDIILSSLVKMTIRIYALDYFLRGIFSFSEFSLDNGVDDYVIEFMMKKMKEEIKSLGSDYYDQFLNILKTPASEQEENGNNSSEEILRNYFIHEFTIVAVEVSDLIKRDATLKELFANNNLDINFKMLKDWLPIIDISGDEQNNRFFKVETVNIDSGANEDAVNAFGIDLAAAKNIELKIAKNVDSFSTGKKFDLSNGNLFLEKYYRVIYTNNDSSFLDEISSKIFNASEQFNLRFSISSIRSILNSSIEKAWNDTFDTNDKDVYLSIPDVQIKINKFISILRQNLQRFNNIIDNPRSNLSKLFWKLSNFMLIESALRLCYIPPVTSKFSENINSSLIDSVVNSFNSDGGILLSDVYDNNITKGILPQPEPIVLEKMKALGRKYKTYYINEKYDSSLTVEYADNSSSVATRNLHRTMLPTPLMEVYHNVIYSDSKETLLNDLENFDWELNYQKNIDSLIEKMIDTVEYKTVFDFSIPLNRFLGFLTVYNIMSASAQENVEIIFNGLKEDAKRVFMSLSNSSYKLDDDVTNSKVSEFLEKFLKGGITPCISFSWKGSINPPILNIKKAAWNKFGKFGMDMILKMAKKTPELILKGMAEIIDPNIKAAKIIVDITKFTGSCVPLPVVSMALLPINIFGPPPFGIGIGPPITPLGLAYIARGFEIPKNEIFNYDDEENKDDSFNNKEDIDRCSDLFMNKKELVKKIESKMMNNKSYEDSQEEQER